MAGWTALVLFTGPAVRYTPWPRPSTPSIPAPASRAPATTEATPADVARRRRRGRARVHVRRARATAAARAALLRGAAARLRAAGDEIVAVAGPRPGCPRGACAASSSAPPGSSRRSPASRRRRLRRGDHRPPRPGRHADPAPDIRRMLVPIGPVAVFGASNFPLAFTTAGGDTASALAAGCPVSSRATRRTRARASSSRASCAPPSRRPACPTARSRTCSPPASRSARRSSTRPRSPPSASPARPRAAARSSTAPRAAPVPIPVYAEMGSINPIVVTDAALAARADTIAEGLAASVSNFGGQLCTKPGVVFVPGGRGGRRVRRRPRRPARRRAEPTCCSTSACATRCTPPSTGLEARPDVRPLGERRRVRRRRLPPPADRYEAPADQLSEALLEEHFGPVVLLLRHARATSCSARSTASTASSAARCTRSRARTRRALV